MGSIAVLKGNIAPEGAIVKYAAISDDMLVHRGSVKAFDSEEDCYYAVVDGKVDPDDILIIRYEGCLLYTSRCV